MRYNIEDRICFSKIDEIIKADQYQLVINDIVLEKQNLKYQGNKFDFKKKVLPNLIRLGFVQIKEQDNQITTTRVRQNLNENIEIKELLLAFLR